MPVSPIPQEVFDKLQSEGMTAALQGAAPPANVGMATTLHDEGALLYRGRLYRVPPVPWRHGVRLMALDFEYRQLMAYEPKGEVAEQFYRVALELVTLLSLLVRPVAWGERLRRALARHPAPVFADAELEELEALRSFFSPARTKSPVYGWASVRAPAWCQPTSLSPSAPLLIGIRAGWRRTATPVASDTSNSDSPQWT
jgi:hypothetical protein